MKKESRRRAAPIFLFSIAVHIAAGLVAGVIVVVRRLAPVEKVQVAAKTVSIPAPDRTAAAAASGIEVVSTAVNDGIRTLTNADAREKAAAKPTEQKSVPVAEAEKAKADAEKAKAQSQQQTQQKTQIDMNIKSNVDGDSVRRAVLNDPSVVDKFFSEFSYTSLPK